MIIHKEIQQGTEEWFLIRHGKIGGTASKGLFVDSDTLFIDILSQHLEEFELEESFESYAMIRGKELEPFAREYISEYTGIDFQEVGWLQSKRCSIVGISPDGLSGDATVACEIKCLGRSNHTETLLNNEAPKQYLHQIIHYFTVNPKLKSLWFIAYRPESVSNFIKEYKRDDLIDLGMKRKVEIPQIGKMGKPIKPKIVTEPDLKTIDEWAKIAMKEALILEIRIRETVEKLKF